MGCTQAKLHGICRSDAGTLNCTKKLPSDRPTFSSEHDEDTKLKVPRLHLEVIEK